MLSVGKINGGTPMDASNEDEISQVMIVEGHTLTITASRICEGEWALSVTNIHGISSNWYEFFESADQAIEAGRHAIETEGAESFISTEGFDYLFPDGAS